MSSMLFDVTRVLSPETPVYPGDEPFSIQYTSSVETGVANVTAVRGSSHAGTHVDLPSHLGYDVEVPLDAFCGPAVVTDGGFLAARRVLIKTTAALTSDQVEKMIAGGIVLVGIEGDSIDDRASESLPNHHALLSRGIAVIENLDLSAVRAGDYELIALPLRIKGAEASWVRAILRR